MRDKATFLYGLGIRSEYSRLFRYFRVPRINWNTGRVWPFIGSPDVLIGFSFGAVLACEYTLRKKVKTLILCSMTTGIESLAGVKAEKVIFLVGERESWVLKDMRRVRKTLKCPSHIIIIPKSGHKIAGAYLKTLLKVIYGQGEI